MVMNHSVSVQVPAIPRSFPRRFDVHFLVRRVEVELKIPNRAGRTFLPCRPDHCKWGGRCRPRHGRWEDWRGGGIISWRGKVVHVPGRTLGSRCRRRLRLRSDPLFTFAFVFACGWSGVCICPGVHLVGVRGRNRGPLRRELIQRSERRRRGCAERTLERVLDAANFDLAKAR
jgi:hypothetical protein